MSIMKLKGLNLDRILDVEEAVELSAFARGMEKEFEALELEVPEWLQKATEVLREEIARRTRATTLQRMKDIQAQLEGLKTAAEKRKDLEAQLASLQKLTGLAPAKAGK